MSRPAVVIRMDPARTGGQSICITGSPDKEGLTAMELQQAEALLADLTDAVAFVKSLRKDSFTQGSRLTATTPPKP